MSQEIPFKYWAFISYSHADRVWADWLHREIETYRVPRRLAGLTSRDGTVPRRLFPVFKDRDELASSAELGGAINRHLEESRYLLVICSPQAARSRWVNEEVRYFKALGRSDRVLGLIVDGEPFDAARDCFPPALSGGAGARDVVMPPRVEIAAADVRRGRDSRAAAKLKLIAGLIGVGYDELRRRDLRRRRQGVALAATATIAAMALLVGAWRWQDRQRAADLARQQDAQEIEKLRQDAHAALDAHHEIHAAALLTELLRRGVDTPALRLMLGHALPAVRTAGPLIADRSDHSSIYRLILDEHGLRAATISQDSRLRLWDLEHGRLLHTLDVAEAGERTLPPHFSGDGHRLALTVERDDGNRCDVFDFDSGARVARFEGLRSGYVPRWPLAQDGRLFVQIDAQGRATLHDLGIPDRARPVGEPGQVIAGLSRSGRLVFIGSARGEVALFDTASLRPQARLDGLHRAIAAVELSDDEQRLAAADSEGEARIWDLGGDTPPLQLHLEAGIDRLEFSTDQQRLNFGSRDAATVWSLVENHALRSSSSGHPGLMPDTTASPTRTIMFASEGGRDLLIDLASGEPLLGLDGHGAAITSAAFSGDGDRLVTGSADGSLMLWNPPPLPLKELAHGPASTAAQAFGKDLPNLVIARFSPDGARIATGGADGHLILRDARQFDVLKQIAAHRAPVRALEFGDEGRTLLSTSYDRSAVLWDVASGTEKKRWPLEEGQWRAWASRDGQRLSLSGNSMFALYRPDSAAPYARVSCDCANGLVFSPDGSRAAFAAESELRMMDTDSTDVRWRTPAAATPAAVLGPMSFSGDGRSLIAGTDAGRLVVMDADTGRTRFEIRAGAVESFIKARFAPGADWAVITDRNGLVHLWHFAENRLDDLHGHGAPVIAADISRDGNWILTADLGGQMRVWSASGEFLFLLGTGAGGIPGNNARIDPAGERVLAGSGDGFARVWAVPMAGDSADALGELLRDRAPWTLQAGTGATAAAPSAAVLTH